MCIFALWLLLASAQLQSFARRALFRVGDSCTNPVQRMLSFFLKVVMSFFWWIVVGSSRWHRSARKGPYALRPVSQQLQVALETVPMFVWLNKRRSQPPRVESRPFLSPLLFLSGDQCCDAQACSCSESSSSLEALLPCQAADQTWYLLCLPVYLPVHSHLLWRAQGRRFTEVFAAEDCLAVCQSGSPFQTPPFVGGS